ncbi:MAG: 3-methyl-2-oxobutanoate hydroxymethyltransferase [Myxococcota bacterium]|nr:3-methyl-2-oxobutanoate hydroxymethyltransferase [Myxococcota bacterium]MDW8360940.1 3-methyl-2-oxobutanoate hydroxymethyltransferase [Myxococcales bacterium]
MARQTRLTVPAIRAAKAAGERLTMVTAYDATFARLFDEAGVEILLVGDSLGMVVQGRETTLGVRLEDVIYHTSAVVRGSARAHVVADMPFLSYQASVEEAVRSAGRLLAEGGAQSVKLEGGRPFASTIARLVEVGIPVMGHVGLMPQRVHEMGGHRVQGRTEAEARRILDDARAVADAGAYAIVLEAIPMDLAAEITAAVPVPTIGIGAGPACDGQVLVGYDLLGLTPELRPRFVRRYAEWFEEGVRAARRFRDEVRAGLFPTPELAFGATPPPSAPVAVEAPAFGRDEPR